MVKLTKIYTKTGDKGQSSLGDGSRLKKSSQYFNAIGDVDETNAILGLVETNITNKEIKSLIAHIQNDLFDLGADLCIPYDKKGKLKITPKQTAYLEEQIDAFNQKLEPLNSFILPGGTEAGALMHVARTVCRRAERNLVELNEQNTINPETLSYMNRLSDLLFVMARIINGKDEILWKPGKFQNL